MTFDPDDHYEVALEDHEQRTEEEVAAFAREDRARERADAVPPFRVLLCLHPGCHGEFYLPLDYSDAMVCPVDREHTVGVYQGPSIYTGRDR